MIKEEHSEMTNYHYRMYNVANAIDEQEVREALIRSKRESRQVQLPNVGERLDTMVTRVKTWFAAPPKPSQQCC
jgi:hypothetical protein